MRLHMIGDPRTERRHGLAVARRAGLVCLSSTTMPDDLFTRALGYGTFAPRDTAADRRGPPPLHRAPTTDAFRIDARCGRARGGPTARAQRLSRRERGPPGPRPRARPRAPTRRDWRAAARPREAGRGGALCQARVARVPIQGSDRAAV